ncbi:sugar ABC transporter substrate-binding protein [Longibacter salinarum]|uniref:Sugar ABC transporter substrate-binding protein n=2 Tax=Longibacter salinarum TaxID=1850348 RepID=A0A2A8D1B8_9BACT|nr:sugar ABC transporter substrate-binding protein [Longibacter salinarum]
MTVQEARMRAQQLGIDLNNPQQAIRRARELGIPESQIQAIIQAVQPEDLQEQPQLGTTRDTSKVPAYPVLAGTPEITPDSIGKGQLPRQIDVSVPLRSSALISTVRPFFLTAGGDTSAVENRMRRSGSVLDGVWGGTVTVPRDSSAGTWTLFVEASTMDTTVTLSTGRTLTIFPKGQLPKQDSLAAGRDSLEYFGYDAFNTIPQAFLPSSRGPVDPGYVVGPSDELRLTVWGGAEFQYELMVDDQGRVTVPNVGQFTVAGRRLEDLRREMKMWLSRSYAGLTSDPPSVFMDLTVTRVQPVKAFVLGEVAQPGGYTLSASSTVFNALYSVGGPKRSGSLRNIKVIREGEVIATVDLYDYLLEGYSTANVTLQNNDYVFVPPRGETVAITGSVERPAYYELSEEETFRDLLDYSGGLEAEAYVKRFTVNRIVPYDEREDPSVAREVVDYDLQAAREGRIDVPMSDGDRVRVYSIREADDRVIATRIDAVKVSGAVFQPGRYELGTDVRTVRDLVENADGLTGDAYLDRASLVRVQDNLKSSVQSVNLAEAMEDVPTENIVLQPGDSLHVASIREMESDRFVRISGQVRKPGDYVYRDDMTIRDLLFLGGGLADDEYLKEVFLGRADLYRVSDDGSEERVIPFHLGDALEGEGLGAMDLKPEDEIRIYPARVTRLEDRFVQIEGAIKEPGEYPYRDNLTLKDVILQANGFEEGASLHEVEVTRMVRVKDETGERARTIRIPLTRSASSVDDAEFEVRTQADTAQVLRHASEFELQHRDRVFVRTDPSFQPQETVMVRGEVRYPGEYTLLRDNERLSNILKRAGGVLSTGYLSGGRLIRGNEQVIVEMDDAINGDADDDVILQPDDEIVLPPRPNTITIRGNVANEGLVRFEPGRRVEYYLERAGGLRDDTEAVFLTQASGATFRVRTGWFRRTPQVDDGAIIRVVKEPEKKEKEPIDIGNTIRDVTGILSSALTIIVLASRAFD